MGYRIAVTGAGSWGTALALLLAERDNEIRLWVYEKELADLIKNKRENALYLPGHTIPENIYPTNSLREAIDSCDIIVSVVPSHAVRSVFTQIREYMPDVPIVSATKGIEVETLQTVSQILTDLFSRSIQRRFASLSGPSFAKEVARRLPTALALATGDEVLAKELQRIFARPYFRVYTNPDVIGVEIGGALKNVIAIATGCSDGLGLGHNARAALITRGLAEIKRLGMAMGAHTPTFYGLSGIGDLVLTCTGELSRNRTLGFKLGQGMKLKEVFEGLSEKGVVAEGVRTAKAACEIAKRYQVSMPITQEVYHLLYEEKDVHQVVHDLMTREMGGE
ncbi:MAG TPA: NAD(P)H-dependent glycerol-3-phosphate dehydrogenase [Nitrospirota bacterium]|nr:NAD(P)H-dependent glycerol-3-phosphate dehydrogenase [Nitrospirota bacterium]